ncbi:OmpA family protein [Streptomyces sp. NPDC096057]|uniref:OmpA family protein n=1 Tax=Streptomyces sp. NPDC096057 TaxID=3155543 RepID=UPI00332DE6B2
MPALLLPAMVAALLSGCASGVNREAAACGWMQKTGDGAAPGQQGHTVILVDVSSSVRGSTSASVGVDQMSAVKRQIPRWLDGVGTVSVATFGGGAHDVRWTATDWAARPDSGGNSENRRRRSGSVPGCVAQAVAKAQSVVPARGGSDVLGAVREAGTVLADSKGIRRLVVLSDGLSTTGCADLRDAAFEEDLETDGIVQNCSDDKEVTSRTLDSVQTVFAGLGQTASAEPQASPAQEAWLDGLWQRLCAAAHPKPAEPADCAVTEVAATRSESGKSSPRRPGDPVVEFPERTWQQAGARALFDANSSVLRSDALPRLAKIAVQVRDLHGVRVRVLGYVDPRGGSANNRTLSQARADAVKHELERLGVRDVIAVGKGVPEGCPGAADSLGPEQKLQCDRRVDIAVVR